MKKFKLISLNINNFKGIKQFSLEANGNDLIIRGKNGSGKTTLFDAFTWLLFGRDSSNRTQFEIKTLDKDGKVKQHGINHEVEGTFELDEYYYKQASERLETHKAQSSIFDFI